MTTVGNDDESIQEERNRASLEAWCEWKRICSILGCAQKDRAILSQEVSVAFKEKIQALFRENEWLAGDLGVATEILAHEFDCGIIEKASLAKTQKNYKDYVWLRIGQSMDPPLKVIRGLLTGPRGFINEIVEKWLKNRGWEIHSRKDPATGKRHDVIYRPTSLEAMMEKNGGTVNVPAEDAVPAAGVSTPETDADDAQEEKQGTNEMVADSHGHIAGFSDNMDKVPSDIGTTDKSNVFDEIDRLLDDLDYESAFRKVIDFADAAILVASAYGLSVTNDETLLSFIKLKKSAVSNRTQGYLRKLKTKLDREVFEELEAGNGEAYRAMLSTAIIIIGERENGSMSGRDFLAYVAEKASARNLRAALRGGESRPLPRFDENDFYSQPHGGNQGK